MVAKKKEKIINEDPLNSPGKGINPLSGKKYSEQFKDYSKIWKNYTVYQKQADFLSLLDNNDVVILRSGTGSGKTVIIPKLCAFYYNYEKKVAMTVPKQILAESSATFSAKQLDTPLGKKVGYTYKDSPKEFFDEKETILEYTTDGKLLAKFIFDNTIKDYSCIIIDEAHERKANIDFLLFFLRGALALRKGTKNPLKLVIMSATIDTTPFINYFSGGDLTIGNIDIEGAPTKYHVEKSYLPEPSPENKYIPYCVELVKDIMERDKEKGGDILIFVAVKKDADELCRQFSEHVPTVFCKELYSGISEENKKLAVEKDAYKLIYPKKKRKVVVATDIAESSITVDNLKYVIDNGKAFKRSYSPFTNFYEGGVSFISKAQIAQRVGRTGRTREGIYFGYYTEEEFNSFRDYPETEIRKIDLTDKTLEYLSPVLPLKNEKNIKEFYNNLIEPPDKKVVDKAFENLNHLGVLNKNGSINKIGLR